MSSSPLKVWWKTYSVLLQYFHHSSVIDAIFFEWKDGFDVWFGADIANTIFVGAKTYIANHLIITYILLERFQFQHFCAPAHARRRQITTERFKPMIKPGLRIQPHNLLP